MSSATQVADNNLFKNLYYVQDCSRSIFDVLILKANSRMPITSPNHVFDFMPCKVKLNLRDVTPASLSQRKCMKFNSYSLIFNNVVVYHSYITEVH